MDSSTWTIVGVIIALVALIVAILQLVQGSSSRKSSTKAKLKMGNGSTANQQAHTGKGDNINAGRDINMK